MHITFTVDLVYALVDEVEEVADQITLKMYRIGLLRIIPYLNNTCPALDLITTIQHYILEQ